ncbi:MAG: radical SAM family heme chaperone HemW [Burkholderiaceae bacterium]|nr:radical SAM family heme chaperone HemW [Burkholderiaceae bacterium]
MRPGALQLPALPPLSLYLHLPWCLKKCPYCDFNSYPQPRFDAVGLQARYVDALLADLEAALPLVWGRPVHSVFMGGGTPSLFAPELIERLIAGVRARLPLAPACEITLEANPGTFERERFAAFRAAGVTRLSVGVQSFNDAHLKALGRAHDGAQARAAVQEAARAFDTFNLDLMYALPGQSLSDLERDVRTALAYQPPHLSIYHLTIEPGTAFAQSPPPVPDQDSAWEMLDRIAALTGQAGLERYEVSAYARPGHHCAHNLNYWRFGDYLGIGAGAHGKLSFTHRIVRQQRHGQPEHYMRQALAGNAIAQEHEVARRDLPFEYMLNALRLKNGFTLRDYMEKTGMPINSIAKQLEKAEQNGWLAATAGGWQPTARGFDFLSDVQTLFLP